MVSLFQGRTAAAQCGLFTHKSVPVIFEPPCIFAATLHARRPFLHHQHEEVPCRVDKDRLTTESVNKENYRIP